jgi:tetratricopeptide (TPR) repeat protein
MALEEKEISQLESYKNDSLTHEEHEALKKRLIEDAAFKKEAHQYLVMMSALGSVGETQTKAYFKEIDKTMDPLDDKTGGFNWLKILLVALALALATLAVYYFAFKEEKPKVSPLIAAIFQPYPALGIKKGAQEENAKLEALRHYANGDYKTAIPLFQKAFESEKDSMLIFYQGVSLIGNGQNQEAIAIFESLRNNENVPTESVTWFLALAYYATNDNVKALPLLKIVENTEGGYQLKAKEIIEKIK